MYPYSSVHKSNVQNHPRSRLPPSRNKAAAGIHVVDGRAVTVVLCRLLLVEQLQTGDMTLPFQQVVQKVQQQGLGELLTEDALEADISKRIDKLSHAAKLNIISETAKEWASFFKKCLHYLHYLHRRSARRVSVGEPNGRKVKCSPMGGNAYLCSFTSGPLFFLGGPLLKKSDMGFFQKRPAF